MEKIIKDFFPHLKNTSLENLSIRDTGTLLSFLENNIKIKLDVYKDVQICGTGSCNFCTANLYTRKMTEDDLDFVTKLYKDPTVYSQMGNGKPKTRKDAIDFIKWHMDNLDATNWLIAEKDTDIPVGLVEIFEGKSFFPKFKGKDFAAIFLDPKFRGKGYALETINGLVHTFFECIEMDKPLYSNIYEDNAKSIKLFEQAGFTLFNETMIKDRNVLTYIITREQFETLNLTHKFVIIEVLAYGLLISIINSLGIEIPSNIKRLIKELSCHSHASQLSISLLSEVLTFVHTNVLYKQID